MQRRPESRSNKAEDIYGGMSLLVSIGGFTLLPLYVQDMLIPSVVARPLQGEPPTIDLVMGYNKSNTSALLKRFVSRADELVASVRKQNALKSTQAR
jgi:LysR family hca operon transcriptional activator